MSFSHIKEKIFHHKIVLGNILSLGTLQILGYIFPLLVLPYVLPIIGAEKYGSISFAFAMVTFFIVLVNYNFQLIATKDISCVKNHQKEVSRIFYTVFFTKLVLFCIATLMYFGIVFSFGFFSSYHTLFFIAYITLLGELFFPVWAFQGMEKMKYITYINLAVKLASLLFIFLFLHHSSQYLLYPISLSVSSLISGVIGMYYAIKIFDISWYQPSMREISLYLKEGWHLFLSSFFTNLYTAAVPFIMGLMVDHKFVGYYSGADKIIRAFVSLINPITQSLFPKFSQKIVQSKKQYLDGMKKLFVFLFLFTGGVSLFSYLFPEILVHLLLGKNFLESIQLVQILSPIPLCVGFSSVFSQFVLLHFGYKKAISYIYIFFSLVSMLLLLFGLQNYSYIIVGYLAVATEFFIMITLGGFIWYKKIFYE